MTISIDIVIPHYKDIDDLHAMLSSLEKADAPASLGNVYIIENGPLSGAKEACHDQYRLPLFYLYSEKSGLANARNIGIKNSKADFIIFFDNDLFFNKDTLLSYEYAFLAHGQNFFYGGPLQPIFESDPEPWKLDFVPASVKGFFPFSDDTVTDNGLFLGGNHALTRACITALGNDVYKGESATATGGGVGEEHRLQKELLSLGFKAFYVNNALVHHPVPDECFSIHWICNRRYRRGLTDSQRPEYNQSRFLISKIPLWVWRRYFISGISSHLYKLFFSPKKALVSSVQQAWAKGVIDGILGEDRNRNRK